VNNAITALIGTVLDTGANALSAAALNADPDLRARMQKLNGNCIEILCTQPEVVWHIVISDHAVSVRHGPAQAPQASVSGTAIGLASWLLPESAQRAADVQIDGDQVMLEEFTSAMRTFRPDFAHPLAQFIGPDISARILGSAELGLQGIRSAVEGLSKQFERPDPNQFVRQEELESILSGIDELRLRMDRLAAEFAHADHAQTPNSAEPEASESAGPPGSTT